MENIIIAELEREIESLERKCAVLEAAIADARIEGCAQGMCDARALDKKLLTRAYDDGRVAGLRAAIKIADKELSESAPLRTGQQINAAIYMRDDIVNRMHAHLHATEHQDKEPKDGTR